MQTSNLVKNIIVVLAILGVIYLGYLFINNSSSPSTPATSNGSITVTTPGATTLATSTNPADEFSALLAKIQNVTFQRDGNQIFKDYIFNNKLENYSQPLPIIDTSRPNPFAPVSGLMPGTVRYVSAPRTAANTTTNSTSTK